MHMYIITELYKNIGILRGSNPMFNLLIGLHQISNRIRYNDIKLWHICKHTPILCHGT